MKAMILAAGKGTRVRPITNEIPKPMIPVIHRPVMEFIIRHLSDHGFKDIVTNTSHLGHMIEDYFKDGQAFGVNLSYSHEDEYQDRHGLTSMLGSAGGMRLIQDKQNFFDEDFVVLCGDAIIDVDLSKAMARHKQHGGIATLILKQVPQDQVSKYGVVVTGDSDQILSFQEKPRPEEAKSDLINTGIYIFSPEIFDHIPTACAYDIGSQLFPELVKNNVPFFGIQLPMQWIDIGKASDLSHATQMALTGQIQAFNLPGKEVSPSVWVEGDVVIDANAVIDGPVYIGAGSIIEKGTLIRGPSVIHENCIIESGAEVESSIIWSNSRVSGQAYLRKRIIFGSHCINPDDSFIDLNSGCFDWLVRPADAPLADNPYFPKLLIQEV